MKYRIHEWCSVKPGKKPGYGIQVQPYKGARFQHCSATVDGIDRALIYKNKAYVETLIDNLNRGIQPSEKDLTANLVPLRNKEKRTRKEKFDE